MMDNDINMLLQHLNFCTQTDTKLSLAKWLRSESFTYIQKAKCVFTRQEFSFNNAHPEPSLTVLQQLHFFMLNNFIVLKRIRDL